MHWRIGHKGNPCGFAPHRVYGWSNRFDDPKREYRTIYCADLIATCFRELLADFRPNESVLQEFNRIFGHHDPGMAEAVGSVPAGWRKKRVLIQVVPKLISGTLRDARRDKAAESTERSTTQNFSRSSCDQGRAGMQFLSRHDQENCHAYFETRAYLRASSDPVPLTHDIREMRLVCKEFGLRL